MMLRNKLSKIGAKVLAMLFFFGGLAILSGRAVRWTFLAPLKRGRVLEQARKAGVDSLPIVALISLFIGVIFTFQIAYLMQRLGSEMYIATIVALSLVRELGPVITALIVAGRVGAAITAEIGSMQVTEQIDVLQILLVSPIRYLVVPRLIALALMLPLLTLYADIIGIFGGYLICVYKLGISSTIYTKMTFDALLFKDLFTGLGKTIVFGMVIALVSCYEGFNVQGGSEGVGRATMKAVVTSFILIIATDCFFTALFYFIFP